MSRKRGAKPDPPREVDNHRRSTVPAHERVKRIRQVELANDQAQLQLDRANHKLDARR